MKKLLINKWILAYLLMMLSFGTRAQKQFFKVYTDSAKLVTDANLILSDFTTRVNAIRPVFLTAPLAVLNTRPFLIFYSAKSNKVSLPIWSQVKADQQNFFIELAGNEKKGKKMFGDFFNGFYLPHEAGHALQNAAKKREPDLYQNEYIANQIAMLYWRKLGRSNELKNCYKLARKIVRALPSPVPPGQDPVKYFNEHYQELGADPYKYGYYQFAQFVQVYEDKALPGFEDYIKKFVSADKELGQAD